MNIRNVNDISIRTKLMAVCILLVAIPVIVLGYVSYNTARDGINDQSEVMLQQQALIAKAEIASSYEMLSEKLRNDLVLARLEYDRYLGRVDRRTGRAALDPNVINSLDDSGSLHSVLAKTAQKEEFDILTVTDTSGKVIARASSTKTGDTFVPDLVRKGVSGGFVATEIIASEYIANEGFSSQVDMAGNRNGMMVTAVHPIVVDGRTVGTLIGGYLLNRDYHIVDSVKESVGGTATIFQNDLRISTNVRKTDGSRAVGTTVSGAVRDAVLMSGTTYYGKAWVVNDWYQTAYEPIRDSGGAVIGILYVGVQQGAFQDSMMNELSEIVIGKTGYIYILDAEGNYILSKDRGRDGENIWNAQDASGTYFIQEICNNGKALKGGETYIQYYPWQNKGESNARMKLAGIAYSPEFDWTIGASCYQDDFSDPITKVRNVTILMCIIAIILGTLVAYFFANMITKPLEELRIDANKIKDGDFGYDIKIDSNDELGDLARMFGEMKVGLQSMVDDVERLASAGVEGDLSIRADASKHEGDYRTIVSGINETLDAVVGPLNVTAEYVDRISKGDIPEKITDEYKGDFNEIKNNLNILIDAENEATMIAHKIGQGNLAVKAEKRSEQDELMESMADMIDAVNMLVADTGMLAQAAVDGKLDVRADASKHGGDFGKIVEEMNGMLDGVNRPLKVVMEYIDRISRGDIPERSTGKARGVFLEIQSSMNQCIDAINAMVDDINTLAQAGIEGRLKVRADASKHGGDFGKIVGGANELLGAVSSPVRDCARVLKSVAGGDLTQKTEVDAQGYLRALLDDTDACVDSMTDIVMGSKKTASKVLGTAEGLAGAAEEMNAGMEQLASASQEVAEGSQKLSELAQVAAHGVESMSAQIEQTSANASRSREKTDDAVRISSEVQEAAKKTLEGLASIQEGVAKTSDTVGEMNTAIEKVGDMGTVITDVAGQTNMLGLNAAIEAARAGEAGRGFAVVADAVKNLAEKVKDAASESAVAVNHIQESGENAINATGTAVEESAKGGELLHTALEGVDRTVAAMGEVSAMVAEIDSSAQQLSEVTGKVVAAIDEVASVSEESASASEETSSSVEEQTSAIEELTAETQGLSDIANQLMDELNRFKIEESEVGGARR